MFDTKTFPLNTLVLLTDILTANSKAGKTGTLFHALRAIADQSKPVTVVVRVAQGKTEAETTSNIIGGVTDEGKKRECRRCLRHKVSLASDRVFWVLEHVILAMNDFSNI